MIETHHLTKKYGRKTAVDDLSITVEPGHVTGFLGPNGAGKSTTMRMIVGLDRPTSGDATIDSKTYEQLDDPLHEVGILLDARTAHPSRTARNHLLYLAATCGLPARRVDEVIDLTGLNAVADTMVGTFSMGMGQRLGIAVALLGDPKTLILDEPVNGLDPEGVHWVRDLVKYLASQDKTVFLSSHLMSEMAITADHLIIIGKGKLIAQASMADLIAQSSRILTRVRSPQATNIADYMTERKIPVFPVEPGVIEVENVTARHIGDLAVQQGWTMHELTPLTSSLESVYLALTEDATEYHSKDMQPTSSQPPVTAPVEEVSL